MKQLINGKLLLILSIFCVLNLTAIKIKNNFIGVPFQESMKKSYFYNMDHARKSKDWQMLDKRFTEYMSRMRHEISETPIIPKKIHIIWLGSLYPERCKKFQETWQKFHPDWEIKLWTDADVKSFKLKNQAAFDRATNFGQKSDIWRLEILDRIGGLYVDVDFLCLKPFDILHHTCEFYIGAAYNYDVLVYNGLIGSVPNHPILKKCINTLTLKGSLTDVDNIMKNTGPNFVTGCFLEIAPKLNYKTVALPITYFYPFPNNQRHTNKDQNSVNKYIRPESFCVHYWDCSWVPK